MTEIEPILIVGAGPAGLAAAQILSNAGHSVRLLEKEARVAEPWRRRHPGLSMNTHRDLSTLPGMRFPKGTASFPHRDGVVSYLEAYADHRRITVEYGVTVGKIRQDGANWLVETSVGVLSAANVIIATGRDRVPWTPDWPGMSTFTGEIVHAAQFAAADSYVGKRVLVVGAGNSGLDILNHLTHVATARLWLSARSAPAILPRRIAGIAVHRLSPFTSRLPLAVADAVIAVTQRLLYGDLTRYGLPPARGGGASRLASDHVAIAVDDGAVAALKAGRVLAVPQIREFAGDRVVLMDGQAINPEIVLCATGYRTGLESMVGLLGVLDTNGLPLFNGADNDPDRPGLWFVGMRPSLHSCFHFVTKQAVALASRIAKAR